MRTLIRAALALSFVLAACATTSPDGASTTPTSRPGGPASSTSLIELPDQAGRLGDDIMLGCGPGGTTFPASALESTIALEDPRFGFVAEAMEPFLASEEGAFWPQQGWRVLHETDQDVLVVHLAELRGEVAVSFMTVSAGEGKWSWSGSQSGGPCELTTSLPPGLNRVDWRLDPEFDVDASFVDLPLLVTEVECASGQAMGARLLPAEVIETDQAVFIAFAALPDEAEAHTCEGNPETLVVVTLEQPLGDRALKDGMRVAGFLADYIGDDFGLGD